MKKIKYLFLFLIALCFMPNVVNAKQKVSYIGYKIGDEITVTLDKEGKVKGKFRIIADSEAKTEESDLDNYTPNKNAEYQYVTAIYDETVGKSIYATSKDKTYKTSTAYSELLIKSRNLGWINYEELRLISEDELNKIHESIPKAVQDKINAELEKIMQNIDPEKAFDMEFLAELYKTMVSYLKAELPWLYKGDAFWLASEIIQYKTYCEEGDADCKETTVDAAYIFDKDISMTYGDISKEYALRPVIKIHKGFVEGGMICNCENCGEDKKYCPNDSSISIQDCLDKGNSESFCILTLCEKKVNKVCPNDTKISIQSCIDGGQSEEACIKKLCPGTEKIENPKTGSYIPFVILGLGVIAIFACISTKNKTYFRKIK